MKVICLFLPLIIFLSCKKELPPATYHCTNVTLISGGKTYYLYDSYFRVRYNAAEVVYFELDKNNRIIRKTYGEFSNYRIDTLPKDACFLYKN